jgi:hypothetical protein
MNRNNALWICVLIAPMLLGACSTRPSQPDNRMISEAGTSKQVRLGRTVRNPLELIAKDFVNALTQITPSGSTIGITANRSGFDNALQKQLKLRGFQTIYVDAENHNNRIITAAESSDDEVTIIVRLDQVALKRSYEIRQNFVRPVSSLYVRGHDVNRIVLDDRIFVAEFGRRGL